MRGAKAGHLHSIIHDRLKQPCAQGIRAEPHTRAGLYEAAVNNRMKVPAANPILAGLRVTSCSKHRPELQGSAAGLPQSAVASLGMSRPDTVMPGVWAE